jgi:hypothetical protein
MGSGQVRVAESDVFTYLARFLEDLARTNLEDAREARRLIGHILERLQAYERQVARAIDHWQAEVDELLAAYQWCEEDCAGIAEALERARRELAAAHARHELVVAHTWRIRQASDTYLREQTALGRLLETDTAHGIVMLGHLRQHADSYAAVRDGGTGETGLSGGVAPAGQSGPGLSVPAAVELKQTARGQADRLFADQNLAENTAMLDQYKVYLFKGLNRYLRTGEKYQSDLYGSDFLRVDRTVWLIDALFGRTRLDAPATLHRFVPAANDLGVEQRIKEFDDLHPGAIHTERAYVSTSVVLDEGGQFLRNKPEGYYFRIEAGRGLSYIPMTKNKEGLYEEELLLPRGTVYFVTGVTRSTSLVAGTSLRVIDVIAFPPGSEARIERTAPADLAGLAERAWSEWAERARQPTPDPLGVAR